jgi:hypothetical protein
MHYQSPFKRFVEYIITVLPILLCIGCTQSSTKPTKPGNDYFADARQCGKQSQSTTKIPMNFGGLGSKYGNANVGGGPTDIVIPQGFDQSEYRVCMEGLGWKVDTTKDPFFALTETCRQEATSPATAGTQDKPKIGGSFDAALYQECVQNNGVKGKVIVLPIKPETTE